MKKLIYLLSTITLLFSYACKKEAIPGCTNPDSLTYAEEATMDDGSCVYIEDLFIGDWKVQQFNHNGFELLSKSLRNVNFEFRSGGEFKRTGEYIPFSGGWTFQRFSGSWNINLGKFKLIIRDGFTTYPCNSARYDFNFDFIEVNELELTTNCNEGEQIRIVLLRE